VTFTGRQLRAGVHFPERRTAQRWELRPENFKSKNKADASNVGREVQGRFVGGQTLFSDAVSLSRGLLRGTACYPKKTVRCSTTTRPGSGMQSYRREIQATGAW
jgi:hypothetical protein